ncbi:hypothetical protein N4G70_12625 [Streptomyces sp. ASQP_92]|uniref:hypothetical protein n=1 Tax=Streptomyces sp. ASQP_92 TaxID=2979116 RepID=UPI0021C1E6B3|nr:hypothetical protein [Streptomyces sp. ASQP_92]MCT9089711.1 hypothetical protein [Streptomyces sp. ASQP_92]
MTDTVRQRAEQRGRHDVRDHERRDQRAAQARAVRTSQCEQDEGDAGAFVGESSGYGYC